MMKSLLIGPLVILIYGVVSTSAQTTQATPTVTQSSQDITTADTSMGQPGNRGNSSGPANPGFNSSLGGTGRPTLLPATADDFFPTPENCSTDLECEEALGVTDPHVVCDLEEEQCRCDLANYWKRDPDAKICLLQQGLGGICQESPELRSKCVDPYAQCVDDGTNTGVSRCRCINDRTDYVAVRDDSDTLVCAKVLTSAMDPDCEKCIEQEGLCYDMAAATTPAFAGERDGCKCPSSKSGPDCETAHVDVQCNIANANGTSTMRICYMPRNDTSSEISVYVNSFGTNQECKANKLTDADGTCEAGSYLLALPLDKSKRDRCGTTETVGMTQTKLESMIVVEGDDTSTLDPIYRVYCSFVSLARTVTGAHVQGVNSNDRGQHVSPDIAFIVSDELGAQLSADQSVRRGQKVRFEIILTADGTYSALKALRCTASSSAITGDPKAETVFLVDNGCPVPNSVASILFERVSGEVNHIRSAYIEMFKLKQGSQVFLHCSVQLCLSGAEPDCEDPDCSASGSTRRKRAVVDEREVDLLIEVYEEPAGRAGLPGFIGNLSTTNFAIIVGLLCLLVLVAVLVVAIFLYKRHHANNKVEDTVQMTPSSNIPPQRFALPRVNRNPSQMRI